MSAATTETAAPLQGAALLARLLGVDISTATLALAQVGPLQRPIGLSLMGCITMQDARQTLGIFTPAAVKVDTYTFGR